MFEIVFIALIILCAAFVQGATGFGFALIAVPFLSLYLPASDLVLLVLILASMINFALVYRYKSYLRIKRYTVLIVCLAIGAFIPILFLNYLNEELLKLVINVVVVLFAVLLLLGASIKIKRRYWAQFVFGVFSGMINTVTAMNGPPLVLFFQNIKLNKREFLAILSFIFLITNIVSMGVLVAIYEFGAHNFTWIVGGLMATLLGIVLGGKAGNYINERSFRRLVLSIVLITGVLNILL